MIWHPRAEWVTTRPVVGPTLPWSRIDTVVVHYTAAPNLIDGDPGERWDGIPAYLRAIHEDYSLHRPQKDGSPGYSIGYNVGVDQRGHAWELRGWDIKAAATLGHNDHTFAILVLIDGDDPASPEAVDTIRELVAQAETYAGRQLLIRGHRDFAATGCPGAGIYAQIAEGVFSPRHTPPSPPPPIGTPVPADPPIIEETRMPPKLYRFHGWWNEFLLTEGGWVHGTEVLAADWRALYGAAKVIDAHPAGMKACLHQCGLELADLTLSGER